MSSETRRLIVHMGLQKTGSTSLHHFLQMNAEALGPDLQILTPRRGTPTRDLGRIAAYLSLEWDEPHLEKFAAAAAAVKAEIAPGPGTTILSHENLPGAMPGRGGVSTLYPRLPELMALLDAHFAPMVPEYVLMTREIAAWKRSVHNQAIRSDSYPGTWEAFDAETASCTGWDDLASRFAAAAPGRTHVFALEAEPDPARPGQQILALAGLSPAQIAGLAPHNRRRNESLNAGSLEFMRLINDLGLKPLARRKVAEVVVRNQGLFVST